MYVSVYIFLLIITIRKYRGPEFRKPDVFVLYLTFLFLVIVSLSHITYAWSIQLYLTRLTHICFHLHLFLYDEHVIKLLHVVTSSAVTFNMNTHFCLYNVKFL